jgi:hypothetical protein
MLVTLGACKLVWSAWCAMLVTVRARRPSAQRASQARLTIGVSDSAGKMGLSLLYSFLYPAQERTLLRSASYMQAQIVCRTPAQSGYRVLCSHLLQIAWLCLHWAVVWIVACSRVCWGIALYLRAVCL